MGNVALTALREARGMSQAELATKLGISASAMSAYELGTRVPRDELKVRIAKYFGVSVIDVFFSDFHVV